MRRVGTVAAVILAVLSCSCVAPPLPLFDPDLDSPEKVIAATHGNEPTAERPKIGCIGASVRERSQASTVVVDGKAYEGKRLPEIVRVIGYTPIEDGRRAKVLRAGEFNVNNWQPWPADAIQFVGCGPEAGAFAELAAEHRKE